MKTLLLLAILFSFSASAPAGVTVSSGLCTKPGSVLESGGLALTHGGRNFVVTSHHRIVPGTDGCHAVSENGINPTDAKLLAWDWGAGLALFEIKEPAGSAVALESLSTSPQEPYGKVRVELPGASLDGKILVGSTDRHHLAALPPAFELTSPGLNERSPGSPVYSSTGAVIGLLSHESLAVVPGHGSIISNWPYDAVRAPIERLGLGFEASYVRAFVENYLAAQTSWRPFIEAKPENVMAPKSIVSVGGLSFKQKCPLYRMNGTLITDESENLVVGAGSGKAEEIGGGNGAGVGGGNGAGVGGGNGAGVGGGENGLPDNLGCSIEVARDDSNSSPWPYPQNQARFEALRSALKPGETAMIPWSYRRGPDRTVIVHRYVSLQHFFRQMGMKDRIEVILVSSDSKTKVLRELSAELLEGIPEEPFKTGKPLMTALERIRFILTVLSSSGYQDILPSDLDPYVVPAIEKNAFYEFFGGMVERSPVPPYPLITRVDLVAPARDLAIRIRAKLVELRAHHGGAR